MYYRVEATKHRLMPDSRQNSATTNHKYYIRLCVPILHPR